MTQHATQFAPVPTRGTVLTKAVLSAATRLGLSASALSKVIGVSAPTVTRMRSGTYVLDPDSKPFELAAVLVRVFRSLDAITGGEEPVLQAWMRSPNLALGDTPASALITVTGLTRGLSAQDWPIVSRKRA